MKLTLLIALSLITQVLVVPVTTAASKSADGQLQLAENYNDKTDIFAKYNGVSGESFEKDPISSEEYNQKNLELAAHIWADSEISQKNCKFLDPNAPPSYKSWWVAINKYVAAEKVNRTSSLTKLASLKSKIESLKEVNPIDLQMETYKIQIEEMNTIIDMISGSNFTTGSKAMIPNSRIGSREALLESVLTAEQASINEDTALKNAYQGCLNGVEQSNLIATQACNNSSKDCARTKEICNEEKVCSTVPDPVNGSCELKAVSCLMVNLSIPLFKKVPVEDFKILYGLEVVPSKELTERLLKIVSIMDTQVNILFSKSTDSKYDWTSPLQACLKPLEKSVKKAGVLCPTDAKDGIDYKLATFDHLGRSDDLFKEINHFIVGSNEPTFTPSFLDATAYFRWQVKLLSSNPDFKDLSTKQIEHKALNIFWTEYVGSSVYTKNFVAGRDLQYGVDQKAAMVHAQQVMDNHNEKVWTCNENNCKTPLPPSTLPRIVIPDYAKVTESAKMFLDALGIKDTMGLEMNGYLSDKWSNTDLIIGQSQNRLLYFKYVEELLTSLITSDRSKLTELLLQRAKAIENFEKFSKNLANGTKIDSKVQANQAKNNSVDIPSSSLNATLYSNKDGSSDNAKGLQTISQTSESLLKSQPNSGISMTSTSPNSNLDLASNGMMTYLKSSKLSTTDKNGRSIANNLNAIKYSKGVNDKIKKLSSQVTKLQKGNGQKSLNDQNKRYENFSKRMQSKTNPKSLAQAGSIMFNGPSSKGNSNSGSSNVADDSNENSLSLNRGDSGGGFGSSSGSGYGVGSGSPFTSSFGQNSLRDIGGKSLVNSDEDHESVSILSDTALGTTFSENNNDQKSLDDAILARDRNRNEYELSENDSIFKRISKSYIRNYEKLK